MIAETFIILTIMFIAVMGPSIVIAVLGYAVIKAWDATLRPRQRFCGHGGHAGLCGSYFHCGDPYYLSVIFEQGALMGFKHWFQGLRDDLACF